MAGDFAAMAVTLKGFFNAEAPDNLDDVPSQPCICTGWGPFFACLSITLQVEVLRFAAFLNLHQKMDA